MTLLMLRAWCTHADAHTDAHDPSERQAWLHQSWGSGAELAAIGLITECTLIQVPRDTVRSKAGGKASGATSRGTHRHWRGMTICSSPKAVVLNLWVITL